MIPAPASGVLCWEVEFHHLLAGAWRKAAAQSPQHLYCINKKRVRRTPILQDTIFPHPVAK